MSYLAPPHEDTAMKPLATLGILLACAAIASHAWAQTAVPDAAPDAEPFVVVCPVEGDIDDGLRVVIERAISEAEGAAAIVFVVDTFGGLVDAALAISDAILKAPCPTVAWVTGKGAISAGAIISFACDDIVLDPASNIGAASPVYFTTEGMQEAGEKEVSLLRAKMTSLAEVRGHNPALGIAMVDKGVELYAARDENGKVFVWSPALSTGILGDDESGPSDAMRRIIEEIDDKTVIPLDPLKQIMDAAAHEKAKDAAAAELSMRDPTPPVIGEKPVRILESGKLLTLSARQAETLGLIPTTASTVEQVLGALDYWPARTVHIEMTWEEKLFRWLTSPMVSGILLMMGIVGLYLEIKTPGFGVPGIISIIGFTLYFGARYVLGLSDWIDIALLIIGVALVIVEIFVLPGFGIAGVVGILCIFAGLYFSFMLDGWQIPQYTWHFARLRDMAITLTVMAGSSVVVVLALWKILPHTPVYRDIVLAGAETIAGGYVVQSQSDAQSRVGLRGVALTDLRPAGKGRFGDETLHVMSRSEYIDAGAPIIVVQGEGNRYVVDPIQEAE